MDVMRVWRFVMNGVAGLADRAISDSNAVQRALKVVVLLGLCTAAYARPHGSPFFTKTISYDQCPIGPAVSTLPILAGRIFPIKG